VTCHNLGGMFVFTCTLIVVYVTVEIVLDEKHTRDEIREYAHYTLTEMMRMKLLRGTGLRVLVEGRYVRVQTEMCSRAIGLDESMDVCNRPVCSSEMLA
jgi:hypothetical protein